MDSLTDAEILALNEALDDEYHSWTTYDQVIADFGEARPFINIRDAETRHIQALTNLYRRYDVPLPANTWPGRAPRFASVQAACEAAVIAEIANGQMYERLLGSTQRLDILTVLCKLKAASQQRHPPAFQRCGQGGGRARRRGTAHKLSLY